MRVSTSSGVSTSPWTSSALPRRLMREPVSSRSSTMQPRRLPWARRTSSSRHPVRGDVGELGPARGRAPGRPCRARSRRRRRTARCRRGCRRRSRRSTRARAPRGRPGTAGCDMPPPSAPDSTDSAKRRGSSRRSAGRAEHEVGLPGAPRPHGDAAAGGGRPARASAAAPGRRRRTAAVRRPARPGRRARRGRARRPRRRPCAAGRSAAGRSRRSALRVSALDALDACR